MKHSRNFVLISSYLTSLKSDKVITVKAKKNFFEKYDQSTGVHMCIIIEPFVTLLCTDLKNWYWV